MSFLTDFTSGTGILIESHVISYKSTSGTGILIVNPHVISYR